MIKFCKIAPSPLQKIMEVIVLKSWCLVDIYGKNAKRYFALYA